MRLLRREIEQCANCAGSLLARAQFENLAEQNERCDDCGGLEVNGNRAVRIAQRCDDGVRPEVRSVFADAPSFVFDASLVARRA